MMMNTLQAARAALAAIPGVRSCRIGLEAGISPADYPLIRLVPTRLVPGKPYNRRTAEVTIYFGMDRGETETGGLEAVYSALFALEGQIREAVHALGGRYLATITDEDRLDTYKLMAVQAELVEAAAPPA